MFRSRKCNVTVTFKFRVYLIFSRNSDLTSDFWDVDILNWDVDILSKDVDILNKMWIYY